VNLLFEKRLADRFKSPSQQARVLTEHWVGSQVFCPNCGNGNVQKHSSNKPVADFFCPQCNEDYELKSKKGNMGNRIVDGAYRTMMERLRASDNPSLFLLEYDSRDFAVVNFLVVPRHFFVPGIIEKRKPLSVTARRACWTGCNINLSSIPESGRIHFVKARRVEGRITVLSAWKRTSFLKEERDASARGWLLDIMACVEKLGREFSLDQVYAFESLLSQKHPRNSHVKDKIRQQLQILRDKGYLEFFGRGKYRFK
jgi:type II restriction enzyme